MDDCTKHFTGTWMKRQSDIQMDEAQMHAGMNELAKGMDACMQV